MATTVIRNGAVAGALAGILADRGASASDPAGTEPVLDANVANAFATQFLTANAAISEPMADADNASIGFVSYAAAFGVMSGRSPRSTNATDYTQQAAAAVASAKALVSKLV